MISRLNKNNIHKYNRLAQKCLTGDGSCSLQNQKWSCFASELCIDSKTANGYLFDNFVNSSHAFVAHEEDEFCGCVTARPLVPSSLQVMFPHHVFEEKSGLISDLCVNQERRGEGTARKMLEAVMMHFDVTYLLVRLGSCELMKERSKNLLSLYQHLGYEIVGRTDAYVLCRKQKKPEQSK